MIDPKLEHAHVEANGISVHTVSMGAGPLVVFCHGFPESWYSWRHQLPAVAEAGFRAVALDMRGYGSSSAPTAVEAYSLSSLVGDVVGVVNALGADTAVVVGHDWGAPVAWYSALMRPDLFRAVAALSVPYIAPMTVPNGQAINDLQRAAAGDRQYYRLFFQEPGVAEAVLEADVDRSVRGFLYTISGDIVRDGIHRSGWDGHFPADQGFAEQLVVPEELPPWLTEEDVAFYVAELSASGFRGGLNVYRNVNALPAMLGPFAGSAVRQPALYLWGEHDVIAGNTAQTIMGLPEAVPGLRGAHMFADAGHWLQQERPTEVNTALVDFLGSL